MSIGDRPAVEDVLAGFDEYLAPHAARVPGNATQLRPVRAAFLQAVSADGRVEVAVRSASAGRGRLRRGRRAPLPGGDGVAWRRRRCGRSSGSCARRACVPTGWRTQSRWCRTAGLAFPGIWTHPGRFEQLIASLDSSFPRGLRDRAIILCMARLGCGPAR